MSRDFSNEEFDSMYAECGRDLYKFARLIIAHTEQRNRFPGIIENTNSSQFDEKLYNPHGLELVR